MNALSSAGYVRAALCVYQRAVAQHPPDARCVQTALSACERAGRWDEGLALLDELAARGASGAALAAELGPWADKARAQKAQRVADAPFNGCGRDDGRRGSAGSTKRRMPGAGAIAAQSAAARRRAR